MRWPEWEPGVWRSLIKEAEEKIASPDKPIIFASDVAPGAIRTARSNALAGGVRDQIRFFNKDFFKALPPTDEGVIITNPPYDKRLSIEDAVGFYQAIGDRMKSSLSGWEAWLFSGQLDGMKHLGLRPSKKYDLVNGAIPCKFHQYVLFSGKRKEFLTGHD